MARVLVVDDEPKLGRVVAEMLELDGHTVTAAGGGRQGPRRARRPPVRSGAHRSEDAEVDGMAVLHAALQGAAAPDVIVMTAFGTADVAVGAMKAGAADYLTKPFAHGRGAPPRPSLTEARNARQRGDSSSSA